MPSTSDTKLARADVSGLSARRIGKPLGIVFLSLQTVEEAEQLISRFIASRSASERCRLGKRLFLHGECRLKIDLRGFHRFVPEPKRDDGAIHPRLKQVHGHGVSKTVDGNMLVFQGRAGLGGRQAMFG